jgi:phosphoglycolate phosphatase
LPGLPAPLTVGFDLDLTLVDSHERILSAYVRALADLGVEVSSEELTPHLGMPLADTALAVGAAVDADALVLRYRHYYDEPDAPRTRPMPGALEALQAVRAADGRTVVVSAKYTPAVHKALAEAGLTDLVDVVYGELFAQDKAGALVAEGASIYVGDHPGDMAAARASSAYAVGVTTGANDKAALLAAGADLIVADLDAFVAWLPGHVEHATWTPERAPRPRDVAPGP